jgi:Uma2 family endonuclease
MTGLGRIDRSSVQSCLSCRSCNPAILSEFSIAVRAHLWQPPSCFVAWERIPEDWLDHAILDAIPNLAAEIIGKSNTPREMDRKLEDYFSAGVELVWFIYPKTQTALAFTSPTAKKEIPKTGALDGGKVLPGFKLPLKNLFVRGRRPANGRGGGRGK